MEEVFDIKDIPQANSLKKVILTVLAVHNGAKSSQEIAAFINMSDRQGRYYRKAAEILGMIESTGKNESSITELGQVFLKKINYDADKVKALGPYITSLPLVNEVLDEFESSDFVDEKSILNKLIRVSGLKGDNATAKRRLSTFVNWLKEIGVLDSPGEIKGVEKKTLRLSRQVQTVAKTSSSSIKNYDEFVSKLNLHINIPYESNIGENEIKVLEALFKAKTTRDIDTWLEMNNADNIARLVTFISSKEEINKKKLMSEKEFFQGVELTHGRLLIETDRAMRGIANNIAKGGNALEAVLASYCRDNGLDFKKSHLFEGLTKNVDFFIPELNLAIECKYSKTSGTKHAGALKDIREQAKEKQNQGYKLGVLIAGQQFIDDKEFQIALLNLVNENVLDYIFTPKDFDKLSPKQLLSVKRSEIKSEELDLDVNFETTWGEDFSDFELGLDDAIRWLKRFLSVDFLNFKSQLYTWIMQTPFAIHTLRLILGWSESKMGAFIKASVTEHSINWKESINSFRDASFIVDRLNENLSDEEIEIVRDYFNNPVSYIDFVAVRESALRGSAIRKKHTSKYFILNCIESSPYEVIEEGETIKLPSGSNVTSSFKIKNGNVQINVLCKYYASSGSVMSDLVKTISELTEIGEASKWIFIVDGPGWLDRVKDLNRMLSIVSSEKLTLHNLDSWKHYLKAS